MPTKKIRRDGTSLVFIQYCYNESNKTLLNTRIAIPPHYWNKKLKRVTDKLPEEFGKTDELNTELKRQLRLAEDIICFAISHDISDPVKFVKQTYTPKTITIECTSYFSFFIGFIGKSLHISFACLDSLLSKIFAYL